MKRRAVLPIVFSTILFGAPGCTLFTALSVPARVNKESLTYSSWTSPCARPPGALGIESSVQRLVNSSAPGDTKRESVSGLLAQGTVSDFELGEALLDPDKTNTLGLSMGTASNVAGVAAETLGIDVSALRKDLPFVKSESIALVDKVESTSIVKSFGAQSVDLGNTQGGAGKLVSLSARGGDWVQLMQNITQATAEYAWSSGAVEAVGSTARILSRAQAGASLTSADQEKLEHSLQRALLFSYYKAYFRNGYIVSADFDAAGLQKKLIDQLMAKIPKAELDKIGPEIEQFVSSLAQLACGKDNADKCVSVGVIGETTFVTRAGKSYGFPGFTVTFDPTASKKVSTNKINRNDLITDLVRVFWEAMYDASFKVPGVKTSTLCTGYQDFCAADKDADKIKSVDDTGDKAESAATAIVSLAVRGGWILALNNETLADVIEVSAGVTARKLAEKATWDQAAASCKTPMVPTRFEIKPAG